MLNCVATFSDNGVFRSGQEVTGKITVYNEKSRMIRAIVLWVEGFCSTYWTEESGLGDDKNSTTYSAREDYINTSSVLTGNGRDSQELLAGNHTFDFHFVLPQTIPSNFTHSYGKIHYQIRVEIERQLKFNYSFKFPFNVISHLDLNHEGVEIRKPLRGDISKQFFFGFSSGKLNISAELPVRGFVGGQTLDIVVHIVNETSVSVERIFIELRRKFLFKCDTISTKTDSKVLVTGNHDGVAAKSKGQAKFSFVVPQIESTSVQSCKYIHVTYEVAVIVKAKGAHRSTTLSMPIVIGTIPLTCLEKASTSVNLPSSDPPPSYDYALNSDNEHFKVETKN